MDGITGYLGPKGSYSHMAARQFTRGAAKPYPSFYALFSALEKGEVQGIVLPVENSLNGGVAQNLDLLNSACGALAVEEINLKIEHRLITLKGADLNKIDVIYSHPQALGQCAAYLQRNFPRAAQADAPSTSAAVAMIKTPNEAAIANAQAAGEGYDVSPCSVSDEPLNFTQFLYVVKAEPDSSRHSAKIFLSLTCAHRPGSLISALSVFAESGLNLTKIESRPIKNRVGEYSFFIEAEADFASPATQSVINSLRNMCLSIKILGCY